MDIGPTELILILVIVVILFGVGRIGKLGKELGSGIRGFKEGLQTDDQDKEAEQTVDKAIVQDPTGLEPEQASIDSKIKEQTNEPGAN